MIILKNLKLILIVIVILFNYKSSLAVENKIIIKVNNRNNNFYRYFKGS